MRIPRAETVPRPAPIALPEDEDLPPNRRGARWPALLTGLVVVAGLGYTVVRLGRPKRPRAVAGLVLDGGTGTAPLVPTAALDATVPTAALDAAVPTAALDAAVPTARLDASGPPAPLDAAVPPAPLDASVRVRLDAGAPPRDDLNRKLDGARGLLVSDPAQALSMIDAVLDDRQSARALTLRADALHRLGRGDAALMAIDAALATSPRNAAAWELKGRILWDSGRKEEARPAYVRYLELQPTSATAETVRRRLSGT